MVRVRFAPSPTGYLHIGGLRTALYNWLFARHTGGTFILRFEDTDRTRYVADGIEHMVRTLTLLGLIPDEGVCYENNKIIQKGDCGPYIQSEALADYRAHAEQLVAQGSAYWCVCTPERLEEVRRLQTANHLPSRYDGYCRARNLEPQNGVIRLKVPTDKEITVTDMIHGQVRTQSREIDDQILLKSDGYPTYHLANVVDDHRMNITHVIRGDEWLPSAPKHVLLYEAFGWKPPQFAHLPLLLAPGGGKLSKRMGDVAVEDFLNKGYLPDTLINFVALLGWNPKNDQEIYTRDELISSFDLEKVNRNGTVLNNEKLDWMNAHYIQQLNPTELTQLIIPKFLTSSNAPVDQLQRFFKLEQGRIKRLDEIAVGTQVLNTPQYDSNILNWKTVPSTTTRSRLEALHKFLDLSSNTLFESVTNLEATIKQWLEDYNYERGEVLWPFRVALSGQEKSPSPFELAWMLGRQETMKRLLLAIQCLN